MAFDPDRAREAAGKVLDAAHGRVELAEPRDAEVRAGREILWIQGGAKGEKMDAVVRDATELGATRFCGARTERSLLKLEGRKAEERRARWERIAREAARQSGRGDGVTVLPWVGWSEALAAATDLPGVARFCAWEGATAPLGPLLTAALLTNCPLAFAAGPEGGLTEDGSRRGGSRRLGAGVAGRVPPAHRDGRRGGAGRGSRVLAGLTCPRLSLAHC